MGYQQAHPLSGGYRHRPAVGRAATLVCTALVAGFVLATLALAGGATATSPVVDDVSDEGSVSVQETATVQIGTEWNDLTTDTAATEPALLANSVAQVGAMQTTTAPATASAVTSPETTTLESAGNPIDPADANSGAATNDTIEVTSNGEPITEFEATSNDGFLRINVDTEDEAREGDYFGDEDIYIRGDVDPQTGTWESTEAEFNAYFGEMAIDIEPINGLSGEIDPDEGWMTVDGTLEATFTATGDSFVFELEAITGQSGDLSGHAQFDDMAGNVKLVDNEYTVDDETGNDNLDAIIGLPSPDPGDNWFGADFDIELYSALGTAEITVTDTAGEPLEGATVETATAEATTDSDGLATLELEEGSHEVTVTFEDETETIDVDVVEDETTTEAVEIDTTDVGTLELTVVDDMADPLAGVNVESDGISGTTDEAGQLTVDASPGEYELVLEYQEQTQEHVVSIEASETTTQTVEFDILGELEVTVTDGSGEPLAGADVWLGDEAAVTGEDGVATLALEPGEYGGVVVYEDASVPLTDIEIESGETNTKSVEIPLGSPGILALTVTDESGNSLPGVAIEGENVSATTDEDGAASIDLPPGTHELTLEYIGEVKTIEPTIEAEETTELTVELAADSHTIFEASNTGGFIAFNETTEAKAREEGLEFPEGEIQIIGIIQDGKWESTRVDFPELEPDDIDLAAAVEAPDGISGDIDMDEDEMAATGTLDVGIVDTDYDFNFEIGAHTGVSGELTGEAEFDDGTGGAKLVDNEYIVEDKTGNGIIDGGLGLPIEDPGLAWLELPLEINIMEEEPGDLNLTVVDEHGSPVPDATVTGDGLELETNDDGVVERSLSPGTYDLTVEYEDVSTEVSVDISSDQWTNTTAELAFTLDGTLELIVRDEADHRVEGATVTINGHENETTELGRVVEALEPGTHDLTLAYEDVEESTEVTVEAGETLKGEVQLPLVLDGTLELAVVDQDDNAVPDAEISGDGIDVTTDNSGEVSVEVDAGTYEVTITKDDRETDATVSVDPQAVTAEEVVLPDLTDEKIVYEIRGERNDFGWVKFDEETIDDATEDPTEFPEDAPLIIEGNATAATGTWESTSTEFPMLEQSDLEIEVEAPHGLQGEFDIEEDYMTAEGQLDVTILLEDEQPTFSFNFEATTEQTGTLEGSGDFDEDGGEVMLNSNDFVVDDDTGTVADEVLGLPSMNRHHNWFVLPLELDIEKHVIEVEQDEQDEDEDEEDGELGTLEGQVQAASGNPISGAVVSRTDTDHSIATDGQGAFELTDLSPGEYEIEVTADGFEPSILEVEIPAGETITRTTVLEGGEPDLVFDVAGKVVDDERVEVRAVFENQGGAPVVDEPVELVYGEHTITDELSLNPGADTTVDQEWEFDGEPPADEVTVQVGSETVTGDIEGMPDSPGENGDDDLDANETIITFEGNSGMIAMNESGHEQALEEGLQFPEAFLDTDSQFIIQGVLHENDTWESTHIQFPTVNTEEDGSGLDAAVQFPAGLSGEIDRESNEMTVTGMLEVVVEGDQASFEFPIELTTAESGELAGEYAFDGESGEMTLVDNEYLIEESSGDPIVDAAIGLPSPESGNNWVELEGDVSITEGNVTEPPTDETDGEDDTSDEDEDDESPSFLVSFAMAIGLLGSIAAVGLVGARIVGRVIPAVQNAVKTLTTLR